MNATRKRFSLRAVCAFLALAGCLLLAGCGAAQESAPQEPTQEVEEPAEGESEVS